MIPHWGHVLHSLRVSRHSLTGRSHIHTIHNWLFLDGSARDEGQRNHLALEVIERVSDAKWGSISWHTRKSSGAVGIDGVVSYSSDERDHAGMEAI